MGKKFSTFAKLVDFSLWVGVLKRDYSTSLGSIWAEFSVVERGDCRLFSIMVASENSDFAPLPYATQKNWFSPASTPRSSPHLHDDDDDDPFIVLTETKFSFRCTPVWIGTLLTGLGSKKKHM